MERNTPVYEAGLVTKDGADVDQILKRRTPDDRFRQLEVTQTGTYNKVINPNAEVSQADQGKLEG